MAEAGEKTEAPTPKKIRDARKKGQVAKSRDLNQAVILLAMTALLSFYGARVVVEIQELMTSFFSLTREEYLSSEELLSQFGRAGWQLMGWVFPVVIVIALAGAATGLLQVRPLFAPEAIQPKPEHLNPVEGFKNLFFKSKTYIELGKTLIKLVIVALLAFLVLRNSLPEILLLTGQSVVGISWFLSDLIIDFFWLVAIVTLFLAVADYAIQQKLHLKELKMTKSEVKREHKESEGDPLVKQSRRQTHQEILSGSMMESVPKADVVVTNPTHRAVALEYDETVMNAPQVTAKGQNEQAYKIMEIARKNRVPVLADVPLARSLWELDLREEIPKDLYAAVAEVLHWARKVQKKSGRP